MTEKSEETKRHLRNLETIRAGDVLPGPALLIIRAALQHDVKETSDYIYEALRIVIFQQLVSRNFEQLADWHYVLRATNAHMKVLGETETAKLLEPLWHMCDHAVTFEDVHPQDELLKSRRFLALLRGVDSKGGTCTRDELVAITECRPHILSLLCSVLVIGGLLRRTFKDNTSHYSLTHAARQVEQQWKSTGISKEN